MNMCEHVRALAQHRLRVVAEIEGMRRAVEELHVLRVDRADDVDGRLQRLAPVLGMRLDMKVNALLLEDRHQLLHRAPPGILAGLDHRAGVAAVAGALVGMRAAAELRVHRVDADLDGNLDGTLPVTHGRLPLDLVVRGPAVHGQERRDANIRVAERLLEGLDPIGEHTRRLEPLKEIRARAEFDPLIAEFGNLRGKLLEREMAMHERVERNLHDLAPRCRRAAFNLRVLKPTPIRERRGPAPVGAWTRKARPSLRRRG